MQFKRVSTIIVENGLETKITEVYHDGVLQKTWTRKNTIENIKNQAVDKRARKKANK